MTPAIQVVAAVSGQELGRRALEFFSFRYDFMIDSLAGAALVGVLCAVVGTFLVLRGLSLIGDATGHATLPGVCVAFALVGEKIMSALLLGALVAGLAASWLVGALSRGPRSRPDAALGIVLSVFFGLGVVLLSYIQNDPGASQAGLNSFLFGNLAAVSRGQVLALGGATAACLALCAVFYRPLVLSTFDPTFAQSLGVPVAWVRYGLLGALAGSVVLSIQAVGVVLVSAMLIIPPSAALFLSKRLGVVLVWSAAIGVLSGAIGAFLSYLLEGMSAGPSMVLVAAALFVLAMLLGPRGGLLRSKQGPRADDEESETAAAPAATPAASG